MEDKNIMDLEDVTLNTLIETGAVVRLIFVNGYQETVRIRDYGAETLLVEDQKEQKKLVYIHAVSTINMG
jgi:RNA chaperone Hfq